MSNPSLNSTGSSSSGGWDLIVGGPLSFVFDGSFGAFPAPTIGDDFFLAFQVAALGPDHFTAHLVPVASFEPPPPPAIVASISDTEGHTWDEVYSDGFAFTVWHTKVVATPFTVTFAFATAHSPLEVVEYSAIPAIVHGANSWDLYAGFGHGTSTDKGGIGIAALNGSRAATPINLTIAITPIDFTGVFLALRGDTEDLAIGFIGSQTFFDVLTPPLNPGTSPQSDSLGGSWLPSVAPLLPAQWADYLAMFIYTPPPPPPDSIILDVCRRAGIDTSEIDVSLLTDANVFGGSTAVAGYVIEQQQSAAEILKPLLLSYFVDACESDGKVKFVPRGGAPALTIPETDLGLAADGAKVKPEEIAQELDLPLTVTVIYKDIALDYQQGSKQRSRSSRVKSTRQRENYSIPIVMYGSQALQVAEALLYLAWLERGGFTFNLASPRYMRLDPTDVVQFDYEGLTFEIRIAENSLGQGFVVQIMGVSHDVRNFLSDLDAPMPIAIFNRLRLVGSSALFLFDLPLLVDSDANPGGTGFYFAAASAVADWTGLVLYSSSDDSNFAPGPTDPDSVTYGAATTTLAAPRSPWELDVENTLTVQLVTGSLAGDTLANVLNGANALIVGGELIQFVDAIQNMDGTYTVSNLLRGRRGTESACGSHGSGELVVAPATGFKRVPKTLGALAQTLFYRGVTVGQDPSAVASEEFAISGADLRPYAPAGVGGSIDGSGNITITWVRRTRIGGEADWADGVGEVPLGEDSELYDVEILNGSTVVRTIAGLTTPAAVYTPAMQTADFGGTQTSVNVNVYQRSAQVGRGTKARGTAPTPGGWPVPFPADLPGSQLFLVNGS